MADPGAAPPPVSAAKAYSAGGSTLLAGALTTVIISVINGVDPSFHISNELSGAIQTLLTAACGMGAVWFTPQH